MNEAYWRKYFQSNFLHEFSSLAPQRSKKTRLQRLLELLWLELFVNLSFCSEGQSMILKVKDSLPLLLAFAESGATAQRLALLVLRNLCFHSANKPVLLANGEVLD